MATVSGGTPSERFGFIADYGARFGVRYLCNWLGVSRSGYYAWRSRQQSQHAADDRKLLEHIRQVFKRSQERYGSPRVHQALRRSGIRVSRKRVERLMRDAGLAARVSRLYRRTPGIERFYARHRNLRIDGCPPTDINQLWVADLTYIKVNRQWRYLAVVMDGYSRRVLGWSLGRNKTAELTRQALRHALRLRRPDPGLIFHTDRGVEYGAHLIQTELQRHGYRASMDRPGRCTDNAHMESFFHSLKAEVVHGIQFDSEAQLRATLTQYIGEFYNYRRLHSALGYCPPAEYEHRAA